MNTLPSKSASAGLKEVLARPDRIATLMHKLRQKRDNCIFFLIGGDKIGDDYQAPFSLLPPCDDPRRRGAYVSHLVELTEEMINGT